MIKAEEVKTYFNKPGFNRFLRLLEKQYTNSKNGARGKITLTNIQLEERTVLDEFFGLYSVPKQGETRSYSIAKFEECLENSRFRIKIASLLEILNGQPVYTKNEQERILLNQWNNMIEVATKKASDVLATQNLYLSSELMNWVNTLKEEKTSGYRVLRNMFNHSIDEATCCVTHCLVALQHVQSHKGETSIRLPVLSAKVTGDAHSLDWKYPLGRLFWFGLMSQFQLKSVEDFDGLQQEIDIDESYSNAIIIREGYRKSGVVVDDLSSNVMFYAPGWFGVNEEKILTLRQVEKLAVDDLAKFEYHSIYIVENPSLFAEIIDQLAKRFYQDQKKCFLQKIIVICGNGQPTTAVLKLIDLLLSKAHSTKLYYAGDLDPAGINIASGFYKRYKESFSPWFMGVDVYLRYMQFGVNLTDIEKLKLQDSIDEWNEKLIRSMLEQGVKLHQELWIEDVVHDVNQLIF